MVSVSKKTQDAEPEPDGVALDTTPEEEGAEEQAAYTPPEPTDDERKNAEEVYKALSKADILGPEDAVNGLLQLIDVHPKFTPPEEWPGSEEEEYALSDELSQMGRILLKGCNKLNVKHPKIVFLWRNKEKWMSGGKTVRGKARNFPGLVSHLLSGKLAVVEINYHHFKTLNPLQRAYALYHELRKVGADGKLRPPDFTGYYDEFEIFGPRVFREMQELARVVEVGAEMTYQFQLPLFDNEDQ